MTERRIERALISVSDKTGLIDLARALQDAGVELISTGGTRKSLVEAGLKVRDIADVTGFPEILDGRVKTLHPHVHAGVLAVRDNPEHTATLRQHKIGTIDLVVCTLYPFESVRARVGSTHEEIIENIDIGGPTLIRAAAKNYRDVAVVTSPEQYGAITAELHQRQGRLSLATREGLAAAAYARITAYDQAISSYFASRAEPGFPATLDLQFQKRMPLRYGENPHQHAAFYVERECKRPCMATAEQLHGKELSYNNILDCDSALNLVRELAQPAAVVVKHNNPCGAAIGDQLETAFQRAWDGDPLSAFGGILAFNREVDEETAQLITEPNRFIECIVAPSFSPAAFQTLTTRPTWKKNVRLLRTGAWTQVQAEGRSLDFRRIDGGLLVQERDQSGDDFAQLKVVTRRTPSEAELVDLRFAWLVGKHVKSNAIVLSKGGMIVGVGAGQMSRVDSVHLAVRKSNDRCHGSVLASDAFFPFRDNVDEAARAGITAIVQPGGSVRDEDSIKACDEHGLAMVFTGVRHFRH